MSREREEVGGGEDVVSVRSLVKMYGDRTVLGGEDLGIESGIVFGLLGPNGAGKCTLLETVAGLRRRSSGRVCGWGGAKGGGKSFLLGTVGGVRRPTSGSVTVFGFDPRRDRKEVTRL